MTDHSARNGRYTVKQLATLSGVSVRTLHHYDEIGLLKPAAVGANGYGYYGREEALRLQQILFHKELGFPLDAIGPAIDAPEFDRAAALRDQRERLGTQARRLRLLMRTIDDTLAELEGGKRMKGKAMYRGFDAEARARQEAWSIERYGEWARLGIEARERVMSDWTEADHESNRAGWSAIMRDFSSALAEGLPAGDPHVQDIVRRLHGQASKAWTGPIGRGGFLNMSDHYAENPDARAGLDDRAPGLADYIAKAMRIFAVETQPWPQPRETVEP